MEKGYNTTLLFENHAQWPPALSVSVHKQDQYVCHIFCATSTPIIYSMPRIIINNAAEK